MAHSNVPSRCPSCGATLMVIKLACPACATEVQGRYQLCSACRLEGDHRQLLDLFLKARGNLRDVQREIGVSYPTARQRIDEMFRELERPPARPDPMAILKKVRAGELTVDEAERSLRGEIAEEPEG